MNQDRIREFANGILAELDPPKPTIPPLPMLKEWEANMLTYGQKLWDALCTETNKEFKLSYTFYDAQFVFFMMYDYTGDPKWLTAAQLAEKSFRDYYVLAPSYGGQPHQSGVIVPWYLESHGLAEDYLRNKDPKSLQALKDMCQYAPYARPDTPDDATVGIDYAREKAFVLQLYTNYERCGGPRHLRDVTLANQILNDFNACCDAGQPYVKPFYLGLEVSALAEWYPLRGDVLRWFRLGTLADKIWELWRPESGGFLYTDRVTTEPDDDLKPAPDLNMLVLPIYWEAYKYTKDPKYLSQCDEIFAAGVKNAYLGDGKHFNQNYRTSIGFVRERVALTQAGG